MLSHRSVDANPMADADRLSDERKAVMYPSEIRAEQAEPFRILSRKRDIAPIAYMPKALAANPRTRSLKRLLTREQGRALEMIGHAVDYLNDRYLYEGADEERIHLGGPSTEAIQILARSRWQILQSAPVREPRTARLWNALFHRRIHHHPDAVFPRGNERGSQSKPVSVLPLSSSR